MKKLLFLAIFALFQFPLGAQSLFRFEEESPAVFSGHAEAKDGFEESIVPDISLMLNAGSFILPFRDGDRVGIVTESESISPIHSIIRFEVPGSATSTVTVFENIVAGNLYVDNRLFQIVPEKDGYILREVLVPSLECNTGSSVEPTTISSKRVRLVSRRKDNNVGFTVDFAEFYTPAFLGKKGESQVKAMQMNAVDTLNTAFRNSGITNVTARLVYAGLIPNYSEKKTAEEDLAALSSHPQVAAIRSQYNADLVGLWTVGDKGVANLPVVGFTPNQGFHVVGGESAEYQLLWTHEVGHNFGSKHDFGSQKPYPGDTRTYNYGWYDCMAGWATVMTYHQLACANLKVPPTVRLPNFSNPDVKIKGLSSGIPGKADNARMIRESAGWVSAYLPSSAP